jgi:hypothetical protein
MLISFWFFIVFYGFYCILLDFIGFYKGGRGGASKKGGILIAVNDNKLMLGGGGGLGI